jgi:hypothetical protein
MSALPFARRFLLEAARTPVNLMVLVVVPVTFVVVGPHRLRTPRSCSAVRAARRC